MALDKNFYNEIYENEQKWIDLIKNGLLPSVYCKYTLRDFYEKKEKALIEEYSVSKNFIVLGYIKAINKIINQIDENYNREFDNQKSDVRSLLPLFLVSQMNISTEEKIDNLNIDKLRIQKAIILAQKDNIKRNDEEIPNYLYEDFPEEGVTKKH